MAEIIFNSTKFNPPDNILKPYPQFYIDDQEPAAGGFDQLLKDIRDSLFNLNAELFGIGSDVPMGLWFFLEEDSVTRPAILGQFNNRTGAIFRDQQAKTEHLYFTARAVHTNGKVTLRISAEDANQGTVLFSVARATRLNGPWQVFYPVAPLTFDPAAAQPQLLDIAVGTLQTDKDYIYKVDREFSNQNSPLHASVIITGIQAR